MELGRRDRVESRGADKDRIGDSQGALKLLESFKFRYETQTDWELAKESGLYTGKEKLFLRYPNLHFPPKSIFNSINSPKTTPIYEGLDPRDQILASIVSIAL